MPRHDNSAPLLTRRQWGRATAAGLAAALSSCGNNAQPTTARPAQRARSYIYEVVNRYPHDRQAFTQGLVIDNGVLFEGTGLYGQSTLRRVELRTGRVLQSVALEQRYFGEGITTWGNRIIQLTWREQVAFVYDRTTFAVQQRLPYEGEGWGLTHNGTHLILSDGTARVRFLEPDTFRVVRTITVRDEDGDVTALNELEYYDGAIYANIWHADRIARIAPQTGAVTAWIDLEGLYTRRQNRGEEDVLNGIAYDSAQQKLYVTGKNWPQLFEIRLVLRSE